MQTRRLRAKKYFADRQNFLNCPGRRTCDGCAMEDRDHSIFATETAPGTAWISTLEGISLEAGVRGEEPARPLLAPLFDALKRAWAPLFAAAPKG